MHLSQSQSQTTPNATQSINGDSWTELGLRTVLDILASNPLDSNSWSAEIHQSNSGIISAESGQAMFSGPDSITNTSDFDLDAILSSAFTSTFIPSDYISITGNVSVSNTASDEMWQNNFDDPTSTSMLEAWRSMIDFPDFMDIANDSTT